MANLWLPGLPGIIKAGMQSRAALDVSAKWARQLVLFKDASAARGWQGCSGARGGPTRDASALVRQEGLACAVRAPTPAGASRLPARRLTRDSSHRTRHSPPAAESEDCSYTGVWGGVLCGLEQWAKQTPAVVRQVPCGTPPAVSQRFGMPTLCVLVEALAIHPILLRFMHTPRLFTATGSAMQAATPRPACTLTSLATFHPPNPCRRRHGTMPPRHHHHPMPHSGHACIPSECPLASANLRSAPCILVEAQALRRGSALPRPPRPRPVGPSAGPAWRRLLVVESANAKWEVPAGAQEAILRPIRNRPRVQHRVQCQRR